VTETSEKVSKIGLANSAAVLHPPGTVAMSRTASVGFSCILGVGMATSQDYVTWTCGPNLKPRFLLYALRGLREEILGMRMGSTHQTIYMPDIERIAVPAPTVQVQERIADYLDIETSRIDALIAKKRKMVSLLEERIDALIRHRISGSALVDPTASAETSTVRKILTKLNRPAVSDGEVITAFRDGQVTARSRRRSDGYTQSWSEGATVQGVREGDVVVHGLDGFSGAIGVADTDGVCSPVYHVCEPTDGSDAAYIGSMLRLLAVDGYLGLFASSTRERAVDFRNWDLFGRIPVPKVGFVEQKQIGDSIRKIAPLKAAVNRSTELAQERRQALITAVVNGEMDVPRVGR